MPPSLLSLIFTHLLILLKQSREGEDEKKVVKVCGTFVVSTTLLPVHQRWRMRENESEEIEYSDEMSQDTTGPKRRNELIMEPERRKSALLHKQKQQAGDEVIHEHTHLVSPVTVAEAPDNTTNNSNNSGNCFCPSTAPQATATPTTSSSAPTLGLITVIWNKCVGDIHLTLFHLSNSSSHYICHSSKTTVQRLWKNVCESKKGCKDTLRWVEGNKKLKGYHITESGGEEGTSCKTLRVQCTVSDRRQNRWIGPTQSHSEWEGRDRESGGLKQQLTSKEEQETLTCKILVQSIVIMLHVEALMGFLYTYRCCIPIMG
ncbi:hypothetical protein PAMP_020358 [Pampus punctatissimus]